MYRVTPLASAFLIATLPFAGLALAQDPRPVYPPPQQQQSQSDHQLPDQTDLRTFAGKIAKSGGKYVLEDPLSNTSFTLDDQKTAKKYDGKPVVVTGRLDASSNTIHVQKIQLAA